MQSSPRPGSQCDQDPWTAPSSPGDISQTGLEPHAVPHLGGRVPSSLHAAVLCAHGGHGHRPGEPCLSSALRFQTDHGENKARRPRGGDSSRRVSRPRHCPGCWLISWPRCRKRLSPGSCQMQGSRRQMRPPGTSSATATGFLVPGKRTDRGRGLRAGRSRAVVSPHVPVASFPATNACLRSVLSLRQDSGVIASDVWPRFPGHTPGCTRNDRSANISALGVHGGGPPAQGDGPSRAFQGVRTGD